MSGFNMERSDRIGAWLAMIRMEAMTGRGGKVEFERVTVTAGQEQFWKTDLGDRRLYWGKGY